MATSILDVKTRRRAVIDSDHFLMQIKFRCRIAKNGKKQVQKQEKLNIKELKRTEVVEKYREEVCNSLKKSKGATIDEKWKNIKDTVKECQRNPREKKQEQEQAKSVVRHGM